MKVNAQLCTSEGLNTSLLATKADENSIESEGSHQLLRKEPNSLIKQSN